MPGLLGKKIGMTSVFSAEGKNMPCTVIEVGPCVVTQVKTVEKDGYAAVQVGFQDKKEKHTTKPLMGHFKKAGVTPKRHLAEFKDFETELNLGDTITVELFNDAAYVDVVGTSKGKGFQGGANTGNRGIQGNQGNVGATGVNGHQGKQGGPGTAGTTGHRGMQGNQGGAGATGVLGNQGRQGGPGGANTGNRGIQGNQGNAGATGVNGHHTGYGGGPLLRGFRELHRRPAPEAAGGPPQGLLIAGYRSI